MTSEIGINKLLGTQILSVGLAVVTSVMSLVIHIANHFGILPVASKELGLLKGNLFSPVEMSLSILATFMDVILIWIFWRYRQLVKHTEVEGSLPHATLIKVLLFSSVWQEMYCRTKSIVAPHTSYRKARS
ncbi:hypothetical protein BU17DRAFT_70656 [Hysterangium stoloniferum]|nr:hypothetical protein BU17DRAFT_70656 [Hysterangium stoloniferum]